MSATFIAGRYEILQRLGRGGMGTVYRARDHRLKREVALKVLTPAPENQPAEAEVEPAYFFLREARAAGALSHPNVVGIYDYADPSEQPLYLVMELIAGKNLHVHIEVQSPLSEVVMLAVTQQVAAALAHAHERGVMHRDVKPGNILLAAEGRVVLTDFGLAKAYRDAGAFGSTVTGRATDVFGTPSFVSPEQVEGGESGPESDVFSLGCVLYAMATGRSPFAGDNLEENIQRVLRVEYTPLEQLRPDLSASVSNIVRQCLIADVLERAEAKHVEALARDALASLNVHDPRAAVAELVAALPDGAVEAFVSNDVAPAGSSPALPAGSPTVRYDNAVNPTELSTGTLVDGYAITSVIGRGAMGVVYAAQHPIIGRKAAVKVLNHDRTHAADALERFIREARVVVEIAHPGIVDIFAFGQLADGRPYLVMEWLEGTTLAARLQRGPLPFAVAARIGAQLADALRAAHARGVIHRDVKPANIQLHGDLTGSEVRAKLLDFGIAKVVDPIDEPSATQAGLVLGTPGYLAPEQARGQQVDGRADVYALGAVLYEAMLGRPVFSGASGLEVISKHLQHAPDPPRSILPTLPLPVHELLLAMLAKDPERRPTLSEVQARLLAAAQGSHDERRSMPALRAMGLVAAALSVGGAVWLLASSRSLEERAPVDPPVLVAQPVAEPSPSVAPTPAKEEVASASAPTPTRPSPKAEPVIPPPPPEVVQLLTQAQARLEAGDHREALRLANRSIAIADSPQARRLIALSRCADKDLSNARAALYKVAAADKSAVIRSCRAYGVDL